MKVYNEKNVYEATMERYDIIFSNFEHIYFSVSGGKDSSIMLQLAAQKAREYNKKIDILYIDLEAQYKATIDHIYELKNITEDVVNDFNWVCLPISLRNATSVIQPKWICWDEKEKDKWVRDMPEEVINERNNPFGFFRHGIEFEEFIIDFALWYQEKHNNELCAAGIGIRSNESFNRFRTIISESKETFEEYPWTTRVRKGIKPLNVYNFYPIYDWETEDDWIAVSKFDLAFNEIYELMYKNGVSIHEQRLCQPYGDDQRNGLDQFRALEYETWEKVLNRVHGANFGNIYARTSLLGNIKSEKPSGMTWEQYTVFLLETIGIYAPELRDHYTKKILTFLKWWEKEEGITPETMPDDKWDIPNRRQAPYWKRIARAIEKNDFWMSRLSFSQTKNDVKKLYELKKKYKNIIRPQDADTTSLKKIAVQLEEIEVKKDENDNI